MTLEDFSELTGISVSHLSLIERDRREPSISNLGVIADAFELPVSILMLLGTDTTELRDGEAAISEQLLGVVRECFRSDERYPATI